MKGAPIGWVRAVLRGPIAPLGGGSVMSAIAKVPVEGPVLVTSSGLEGDFQADTRVHGGVDKAVHCYAWCHYLSWRAELPGHPLLERPGAFGENLSVDGADENTVFIGDVLAIGSARFSVSQGRQPCFKLNHRFGQSDMAARMQASLRSGWYLRVSVGGVVQSGSPIHLVERLPNSVSVAEALRMIRDRELRPDRLRRVLELPIPAGWRQLFARRLESRAVEDWSGRLQGPPGSQGVMD